VAERLPLALSILKLREVLRNQSIRDPLAGLFNRRYLEETLVREVNRATRKNRNVAVVMLDLDLCKDFNDTFGHQAGDLLLPEVAGVLKGRVRAGDLACRFGGEEFALILSEVDAHGTGRCVDIIRQEIKHLPLQHRGQALRSVTISAGIAIFPVHGTSPKDLIRAADAALYQAKRAGRDRVVVSGDEVSSLVSPAKT
jgi:diguanylate cyclase (GGDEF)-like protein